ncbi:MAG: M14 family metallopeptidase [Fodinibius sp.]|nr:M14 family metallopeptidase [Fodinibius sp.]
MKQLFLLLTTIIVAVTACSTSDKFTGFSYDPEGVTETSDKEINQQYKKVIGLDDRSLWISNEFAGARLNDFYQVNDSLYRAVIEAENEQINNSPWYAFKIWSDTARTIKLQLSYKHGKHRYIPKLSPTGQHWQQIDSTMYSADTLDGTATLTLQLGKNPQWVAAQELLTENDYTRWMKLLNQRSWISLDTVGYSHDRRPITKMTINQTEPDKKRGVLVITGRQHPPEVTGALASKIFINELVSDSKTAEKFREEFEVWSYPLINPDGVQRGHWRHNAAGVDLNRDWQNFNQPETQSVRDDLLALKKDSLRKVYYGIDFHSTNENLFYPINRDISTFPEDFTYQWIDTLKQQFPDYPIKVEPFDTSSPITKNWIYRTFGADAVTYELNDQANRDSLRTVTQTSARIIMQNLLEAKQRSQLAR